MAPKETLSPERLNKQKLSYMIGISINSINDWVEAKGCPCQREGNELIFSLPEVFEWRIKYEKKNIKEANAKAKDEAGITKGGLDPVEFERCRKLKLENDEKEGLLVDKKQMENQYFNLGKTIKDNLISKPPIWAPQLEMKSSFEIMTLLRKYIEQFCNLTITLKEPTNEQSDKPDSKPF